VTHRQTSISAQRLLLGSAVAARPGFQAAEHLAAFRQPSE
jgi:hypothetical protein